MRSARIASDERVTEMRRLSAATSGLPLPGPFVQADQPVDGGAIGTIELDERHPGRGRALDLPALLGQAGYLGQDGATLDPSGRAGGQ